MNPSVGHLFVQGLIIAAIGIVLVFAALVVMLVLTRLLTQVFADKAGPAPAPSMVLEEADAAEAQAALEAAAEVTEERARVAAIVAAALLSNALPLLFQAPTGPTFEHGRVSPSWVSSNRTRSLQSWQPPRSGEGNPHQGA